jgi:hypothetical protein
VEEMPILRVRAAADHRFVDHLDAVVRGAGSIVSSRTERASDGASIDVTIDLASSAAEPIVELSWRLEGPANFTVDERVVVNLTRSLDCRAIPCRAEGPVSLPNDLRCL